MIGRALTMALALGLIAPGGAAAAQLPPGTQVKICDDVNEWSPYTEWERLDGQRTGRIVGRSVRLIQSIAKQYGWELKIELLPWKRCMAMVEEGQGAHMFLNALVSPDREQRFLISQMVYEIHTDVLWSRRIHPNGLNLKAPEDLKRYRMGGILGHSYPVLDRLGIPLSSVTVSQGSLAQMLHLNRFDAAIVGREVIGALRDQQGQPLRSDPDLGQSPLPGALVSTFHMMFTRKAPIGPALKADIDAELHRLRSNGELARMMNEG